MFGRTRKNQKAWSLLIIISLILGAVSIDNFKKAEAETTPSQGEPAVVYKLNGDGYDEQGLFYTLTETYGERTASVGKADATSDAAEYMGDNSGVVVIPDYVEKDGEKYPVKTIGERAFSGNAFLKEIILSDSVEKICSYAFSGTILTKIHLGSRVRMIETNSFANRKKQLQQITASPKNPSYVVRDNILYNTRMTRLILSASTEETLSVPESVVSIGEYAFCKSVVRKILLPQGTNTIEKGAFLDSKLETIDLAFVGTIGADAFRRSLLKTICLAEGASADITCIRELQPDILDTEGLSRLTSDTYLENAVCKAKCLIVHGNVIQNMNNTSYWTEIVILADDVTALPAYFLRGSTKINKIYVPSSVTTFGNDALKNENITIYGEKDSPVEEYALEKGLSFVDVSQHEHQFSEHIFYQDDFVVVKGHYCEECGCCKGIEKDFASRQGYVEEEDIIYELDENNKDSQGVYYFLNSAGAVIGGYDTTQDNTSCFEGEVLQIPDKVVKDSVVYTVNVVGDNAFRGNSTIKKIKIPKTLEKFNYAINTKLSRCSGSNLRNCPSLESIEVSGQNSNFMVKNGCLYSKDGETLCKCFDKQSEQIEIPKGVRYIEEGAFQYSQIKRLDYLPESILAIDKYAFSGSAVEKVKLCDIRLEEYAFNNCKKLKWIWLENINLEESCLFANCSNLKVAYMKGCYSWQPPRTFMNCTSLKAAVFDGGGLGRYNDTYDNCKNLTYSIHPDYLGTSSSVDTQEQEHEFTDTVFYEDDSFSFSGKYCSDCGRGKDYILLDKTREGGEAPTQAPTEAPTQAPTEAPTKAPTDAPTQTPTEAPTQTPTEEPTKAPTEAPTQTPTEEPTKAPTEAPTQAPTKAPTTETTTMPTKNPAKQEEKKKTTKKTSGDNANKWEAPTISMKKGKSEKWRFIQISLKKYKGTNVEIYMRKGKKKYQKLSLAKTKIKAYKKGRIKILYRKKKQTLYFKVRTWKKKGNKKIYSEWSKEKKIKT